jgi:hypothetical protein
MKGITGLIVAVILGGLAMSLNFLYLREKSKNDYTVNFIAVRKGVTLKTGDVIKTSDVMKIPIPKDNARYLSQVATSWDQVDTLIGRPAIRDMEENDVLLRQDYKTPKAELDLKENERLIWIPIDSRMFVPSLLNPGDEISFLMTSTPGPPPTEEQRNGAHGDIPVNPAADPAATGKVSPHKSRFTTIGPFMIGSLGNRLGARSVMKAHRVSQVQERSLGIIVTYKAGEPEKDTLAKLLDHMLKVKRGGIYVVVHPRKKK